MSNEFEYRDKDWLYNEMITLGKTEQEVADDHGWKIRVVRKWAQIYGFGDNNFKVLKQLSPDQKELVLASLLGDGHITPEGIFIVSHCEKQKDYLFWKYRVLEDCCKTPPALYQGSQKTFKGKTYNTQRSYRFNTRKINQLKEFAKTGKANIIQGLSEFRLSVWLLDDGYRDKWTWDLCVASLSPNERETLESKLDQLGLRYKYRVDPRYIRFNSESTKKLDLMILENIPNDLDIIQYKISKKSIEERKVMTDGPEGIPRIYIQ